MKSLFGKAWREKLKDFVLIIDEFPSSDSRSNNITQVFVGALGRNFARAVNLPCLVMGTHTRLSNLVEAHRAGGSSVDGVFRLWCYLFTRLPSTNWKFLFEEYKIRSIFDKIVKHFGQEYGNLLKLFFNRQIKTSRPGISKFICESLRELYGSDIRKETTLIQFMTIIASKTRELILNRKESLKKEQSIPGHLELFMANTLKIYPNESADQSAMINYHMFYLINGTDEPFKKLYAKYVVYKDQSPIYDELNGTNSWIPTVSITSPINEIFLYWSCWGFFGGTQKWFSSQSLMKIYLNLWKTNQATQIERGNIMALSNNGAVGEHIAHILVIFCSHIGGFGGINGMDFIKWLVKHSVIVEDVNNPQLEVEIRERSKLSKFLRSFGVCYLSPCNACGPNSLFDRGWPPELCGKLMRDAGLRLGFERGARNEEMINGEMEIYSVTGKEKFIGKFEVKLHETNLTPVLVMEIMRKNAPNPNERVFSLIFCQSVSKSEYFNASLPFQPVCSDLKANIYTVVIDNSNVNKYTIVPLYEDNDDPQMVCIVLPILFSTIQDFMPFEAGASYDQSRTDLRKENH